MPNQTTNYAPQPQDNTSGANTVLLVVIIALIIGGGIWWYKHYYGAQPANPNNSSINVDVNLPSGSQPSTPNNSGY